MNFFQVVVERPELKPETLFSVFSFPITNVFTMSWLVIFILLVITFLVRRNLKPIPSTLQMIVEIVIEGLFNVIKGIVDSNRATRFLLPLIGALFLFLILGNLLGLILPGLTAISFNGVPFFRTPSTDFNMTFALALGMSILTHIMSIYAGGFFNHLGKFFPVHKVFHGFKQGIGKGMMSLVDLFIGLMDVVSEIAKVISLSMRLFGNLYAGEVMMAILYGLIATVIPAAWIGMSLLSGTVQAVVFAMLATVFYSLMVEKLPEKE